MEKNFYTVVEWPQPRITLFNVFGGCMAAAHQLRKQLLEFESEVLQQSSQSLVGGTHAQA
jgi:hypothetical protein